MRWNISLSLLLHFVSTINSTTSDASCKLIPSDVQWPAKEVWEKALPGVVFRGPQDAKITRPDYQLTVTSVEQVQNAVKFAAEHNIRLTILNSGHDFLGRNDAPTGLSLLVTNLKGVQVLSHFRPTLQGAQSVNYTSDPITGANVISSRDAAVTFGVGVTGQQLNTALARSGLVTMAAMASRVSVAGGYAQTAGHGPLTSKYGLAADVVLEYKVVTSDGKLRIANAVSEPDLFWALRGGGGGTFGVVVEATVKAFPSPKLTVTRWWLKTIDPNDTTSIFEPAAYALSQMPYLNQRHGTQGYFYIYPNEIWISMINVDEQSGISKANASWAPILDKLATFPGVKKPIHQYTQFPTFERWFDSVFGPLEPAVVQRTGNFELDEPNGRFVADEQTLRFRRDLAELEGANSNGISPMDSRLLGVSHLYSPLLADSLRDSMPKMESGMLRGHLTAGGKVLDVDDDATSVHPAWRKAYIHLIGTGGGTPDVKSLKRLAPDMGCYANECFYKEIDYRKTMWGRHYNRLYAIKKKYDERGLFWVSPGIGADDFYADATTGRVCSSANRPKNATLALDLPPLFDNQNPRDFSPTAYNTGPASQEAADKGGPPAGE